MVRHVMAWQMIGQWLAARLGLCRTGSRRQCRGHGFRLCRLDIFQRQFELFDGAVHLLGGRAEPCPLENGKLRLQFVDQEVAGLKLSSLLSQLIGLRSDDGSQCIDVFRQVLMAFFHAKIYTRFGLVIPPIYL